MNSLKINTGEVRLMIDDDPNRVIAFNPSDVAFIERFMKLYRDMDEKQEEIAKKEEEINAVSKFDANNIPDNANEKIKLAREVIGYMRDQIDVVFGSGTSETVFGDVYSTLAVQSFLEGITPFIHGNREEVLKEHLAKGKGKALK